MWDEVHASYIHSVKLAILTNIRHFLYSDYKSRCKSSVFFVYLQKLKNEVMGKLICTCGHSDWEINIAGNGFCNNCNRPMPKSSGLPILGHIFEGDEIIEEDDDYNEKEANGSGESSL